ncbi:Uncharacterised protein [Mycobacteroides abscessus subsp. abscessus]|nr:Uncharacterised protein [Mycobacteroides abscessus subsp. abscessus]
MWRGDLSENSAQLAPIDQHIIGPLEPGLDSTDLGDGIDNRHSGQERHQPPPVRRHLAHSDTHRHGQLRVGGGAPGTAVASTPCGLMLGEQHDAVDVLPRRGARHQIGIGRSGFLNDVDASPVAAGAVGESQSVRSHGPQPKAGQCDAVAARSTRFSSTSCTHTPWACVVSTSSSNRSVISEVTSARST